MKYYESSTIFHYTWEQVAQAFWRRYPNPYTAHVLSEDTISREVQGGKLYSRRLLVKTSRVPKWGEKLITTPVVSIVEDSIVDPKEKLLITYTRNIGFTKLMTVVEKITYKASKDNSYWTVVDSSAWIDSHLSGLKSAILVFGFNKFKKNCKKMLLGFNYVLDEMFPHNANTITKEETINHQTKSDKLRNVAKAATDLAKSKANSMFASCEPKEL